MLYLECEHAEKRSLCAGIFHLSSLHALRSLSLCSCTSVLGEAFLELSEVKGLQSLSLDNCSGLSRAGSLLWSTP